MTARDERPPQPDTATVLAELRESLLDAVAQRFDFGYDTETALSERFQTLVEAAQQRLTGPGEVGAMARIVDPRCGSCDHTADQHGPQGCYLTVGVERGGDGGPRCRCARFVSVVDSRDDSKLVVADVEWAVIGYDKSEQCEFIERREDRGDAEYAARSFYSSPSQYRDVRVVCRTVGEWKAADPDLAGLPVRARVERQDGGGW